MIRVLVCDDHALVRRGLRQIVEDAPDCRVAAEAADGPAALRELARGGIDVVLLDIALPGRDGLDVLRQMRREYPSVAVVVVSTYPETQYAVRCVQLGAAGYLHKSAEPAEFIAALRRAAGGGVHLSAAAAAALAEAARTADGRPAHARLSTREYQVFLALAAGRTLTEIAQSLALSLSTVSTYRARILEKLRAHNDVEIALYAVRHRLLNGAAVPP